MEYSEKDASRSKWKLSQRHRQGRRGRGGGSSAGRGGRGTQPSKLGSNEGRYIEPEADEREGPVRKSQGADLAELLERADVFDVAFYQRAKANLLEDYGLPPKERRVFQGLSLDLKGLAYTLSLLPRGAVLDTDAYESDMDTAAEPGPISPPPPAEGGDSRESLAVSGGKPDVDAQHAHLTTSQLADHASSQPPGQGQQAQPAAAAPPTLDQPAQPSGKGGDQGGESGVQTHRQSPQHLNATSRGDAVAATAPQPHVQPTDDQEADLDFLLGTKRQQEQQQGQVQQEGTEARSSQESQQRPRHQHLPHQQQGRGLQGRQEGAQQTQQQAQQAHDPLDAELDFLLGLAEAPSAGGNVQGGVVQQAGPTVQQHVPPVVHQVEVGRHGATAVQAHAEHAGVALGGAGPPQDTQQGEATSLDDWLDSL